MRSRPPFACLGLLLLSVACSQAEDRKSPEVRLATATELSSLTDVSRPWHLKLFVSLFENGTEPSIQGIIERWQAGADLKP